MVRVCSRSLARGDANGRAYNTYYNTRMVVDGGHAHGAVRRGRVRVRR